MGKYEPCAWLYTQEIETLKIHDKQNNLQEFEESVEKIKIEVEILNLEMLFIEIKRYVECKMHESNSDSVMVIYEKIIEIAEIIISELEVDNQRCSYSHYVSEICEIVVLVSLYLDKIEQAYNYIEHSKTHSFENLFGNIKINKSPLSISKVQKLLNEKETIIEYFLTKKKILIWLITKNNIPEVFSVEISKDRLKTLIKNFRESIIKLHKINNKEVDHYSTNLYNFLVTPVVDRIKTDNLIIIPDGILHYLPFQALQNKDGKYLIDKYQIRYLPSASIMNDQISKNHEKMYSLLAFGDPNNDLPYSEKEVNNIGRLYPNSKILIGSEATKENFKELAGDYDILHLSCHSEVNPECQLFSSLLLAPRNSLDGKLFVYDIIKMDLNAYLVVLSGCETALGNLRSGDELASLSGAFIYAGVPSIISSLWRVEDESTAYLMEQFYRNLRKYDEAESLRRAQLKTKDKYEDIRSWAPFVLIGK